MLPYIFHEDAEEELGEQIDWYDRKTGAFTVGDRFRAEVGATVDAIRENPGWWPVWPDVADWPEWDDLPVPRSHRVKGYDYRVVYVVMDEIVVIVAVASTRREPGYWRHRGATLT
jgi:hypothetical protein